MRVAHTGLTVSDLDRAIGFFGEVLGFQLLSRGFPADPNVITRITGVVGAAAEVAMMTHGGHDIELLCFSDPKNRTCVAGRACDAGFLHLAMMVEDLDGILVKAASFGYRPAAPVTTVEAGPRKGRRAVYLRNDDGITIELMQD